MGTAISESTFFPPLPASPSKSLQKDQDYLSSSFSRKKEKHLLILHKGKISGSCKYNRTLVIDSTSRTQITYGNLVGNSLVTNSHSKYSTHHWASLTRELCFKLGNLPWTHLIWLLLLKPSSHCQIITVKSQDTFHQKVCFHMKTAKQVIATASILFFFLKKQSLYDSYNGIIYANIIRILDLMGLK